MTLSLQINRRTVYMLWSLNIHTGFGVSRTDTHDSEVHIDTLSCASLHMRSDVVCGTAAPLVMLACSSLHCSATQLITAVCWCSGCACCLAQSSYVNIQHDDKPYQQDAATHTMVWSFAEVGRRAQDQNWSDWLFRRIRSDAKHTQKHLLLVQTRSTWD